MNRFNDPQKAFENIVEKGETKIEGICKWQIKCCFKIQDGFCLW